MKKREKGITFLGKDTEFEGKLTFHGTIWIEGHFRGEISADGNLIVGEEAKIEANMHISYIVIRGEIHGNIIADQRVDILGPGKVFGNIQAPSVVTDEGAIFWGETRMPSAKEAGKEKSAIIGSDEYAGAPPPTVTAIYGIVTDQETGNPIKNAKVKCKGVGQKNIETNTSGYYEVTNLKDGRWRLKIKAKGYKKGKAQVEISGGKTYEQNFELRSKRRNSYFLAFKSKKS
ncbi:MAG: polymer-forming cytoskeletal protein [Deltaproteobacteria bacterium]|nr:MAG: polymer-forming cytoskeletal protein [Deltaproteobacteria bacterium]